MLWVGCEGDGFYSNYVYGFDIYFLFDFKYQINVQYLCLCMCYLGQVLIDFNQFFGVFEDDVLQFGYNYNFWDWQNWFWFEECGEGFCVDSGFVFQVDYCFVNGGVLRRWWGEFGDILCE